MLQICESKMNLTIIIFQHFSFLNMKKDLILSHSVVLALELQLRLYNSRRFMTRIGKIKICTQKCAKTWLDLAVICICSSTKYGNIQLCALCVSEDCSKQGLLLCAFLIVFLSIFQSVKAKRYLINDRYVNKCTIFSGYFF